MKFATIEAIFVTTVNDYLTLKLRRDTIKHILQHKSTVLFQFQETSYYTKLEDLILNVYHLLLRIIGLCLTSKR